MLRREDNPDERNCVMIQNLEDRVRLLKANTEETPCPRTAFFLFFFSNNVTTREDATIKEVKTLTSRLTAAHRVHIQLLQDVDKRSSENVYYK